MVASLISPKVLPEGSRQGAAREIRSPECVKVRFHASLASTRRVLLTKKFKRRLGSLSNGSEYSFLIYFRVDARLKFRFSADGPSSRHLGRLQPTYLLMKNVLRR